MAVSLKKDNIIEYTPQHIKDEEYPNAVTRLGNKQFEILTENSKRETSKKFENTPQHIKDEEYSNAVTKLDNKRLEIITEDSETVINKENKGKGFDLASVLLLHEIRQGKNTEHGLYNYFYGNLKNGELYPRDVDIDENGKVVLGERINALTELEGNKIIVPKINAFFRLLCDICNEVSLEDLYKCFARESHILNDMDWYKVMVEFLGKVRDNSIDKSEVEDYILNFIRNAYKIDGETYGFSVKFIRELNKKFYAILRKAYINKKISVEGVYIILSVVVGVEEIRHRGDYIYKYDVGIIYPQMTVLYKGNNKEDKNKYLIGYNKFKNIMLSINICAALMLLSMILAAIIWDVGMFLIVVPLFLIIYTIVFCLSLSGGNKIRCNTFKNIFNILYKDILYDLDLEIIKNCEDLDLYKKFKIMNEWE